MFRPASLFRILGHEGGVVLEHCESGRKIPIDGEFLEAQFSDGEHCIVFVWSDPWEALGCIYLLDLRGELQDAKRIFAPYSTGAFRDLESLARDGITFSFFEGDKWMVQVAERGWLMRRVFRCPRFRLRLRQLQ